jgi:Na+/proline symporter
MPHAREGKRLRHRCGCGPWLVWIRTLGLAVAATGVIATMPYIALQLVGMATAVKALGLVGELPLVAAFVILALYTYSSGLRAPALILAISVLVCSPRLPPR